MTIIYLASLIVIALGVGWWLRSGVREPPDGIDPTFWADAVRKWRSK